MDYLYLAPNIEKTAFKIGFSDKPDTRLNNVSGNIDYGKTHLFECHSVKETESFCHKYFNEFNIKIYEGDGSTEWFDISIFASVIKMLQRHSELLDIVKHYKYYSIFSQKQPSNTSGSRLGRSGTANIMTATELVQFLRQISVGNHGIRNVAIITLSHRLGLKAKELARLHIHDIIDDNGVCGELRLKNRVISMTHPEITKTLQALIDNRKSVDGRVFNHNAPLFRSQKGTAFTPNSMCRMMINLYKNNGFPGCSSHTGKRSILAKLFNQLI